MEEFEQGGLFEYPGEADRKSAHRELKKIHDDAIAAQEAAAQAETDRINSLPLGPQAIARVNRHVAAGEAVQAAVNAGPSEERIDDTSPKVTGSTVAIELAKSSARAQVADAHDSENEAALKVEAEERRAVTKRAVELGYLPGKDPSGLSPRGRANMEADAEIYKANRKQEEIYRRMNMASSEAQEPESGAGTNLPESE